MATLRDVLKMFIDQTDQEFLDSGDETRVISVDTTQYSYAGLAILMKEAGVATSILLDIPSWVNSLIGGPSLHVFLLPGKCDFSTASIQEYLGINLQASDNEDTSFALQVMMDIGVHRGTLWEQYEIPKPTIEEVAEARATIATFEDKASFADRYNQVVAAWDAGEIKSLAEAKAAMGAD